MLIINVDRKPDYSIEACKIISQEAKFKKILLENTKKESGIKRKTRRY